MKESVSSSDRTESQVDWGHSDAQKVISSYSSKKSEAELAYTGFEIIIASFTALASQNVCSDICLTMDKKVCTGKHANTKLLMVTLRMSHAWRRHSDKLQTEQQFM